MAACGSIITASVCLAVSWIMLALVKADAKPVLDPTGMVNLNKDQAYTNSLLCFQNTTTTCPVAVIGESGKIKPNNTAVFCGSHGCLNQTLVMLKCVDNVYKNFRFNNDGSTNDVRAAIIKGCTPNSILYGNFTVVPTSNALANAVPSMLMMVVAIASIIFTNMNA